MYSKLYTLKQRDWFKAFSTMVYSVVIAMALFLGAIALQPDFDVFQVDWSIVMHQLTNLMIVTFFTRLVERFSTDQNGRLFGKL